MSKAISAHRIRAVLFESATLVSPVGRSCDTFPSIRLLLLRGPPPLRRSSGVHPPPPPPSHPSPSLPPLSALSPPCLHDCHIGPGVNGEINYRRCHLSWHGSQFDHVNQMKGPLDIPVLCNHASMRGRAPILLFVSKPHTIAIIKCPNKKLDTVEIMFFGFQVKKINKGQYILILHKKWLRWISLWLKKTNIKWPTHPA